jgi:copper chaperone
MMQTLQFDIHGMTCGGCTSSVHRVLSKIDGVSRVDVSLRPGTATMDADTTRVTPNQIEAAIRGLGYQAKLHPDRSSERSMT